MTEKSRVWECFTADGSGIHCNQCDGVISQGSDKASKKNTSNLWAHLKNHHPEIHDTIKQTKIPPRKRSYGQSTVLEMFEAKKKWHGSDSKSRTIDKLLVEMMATDNQPFTIVEDPGFQRLIHALEPRYPMKTEKFYRTEGLSSTYERVVEKVQDLMTVEKAGNYISFTTDCWSGSTESLMSLTAHYVDEGFERRQVVLNVKATHDSHTGEYIAETFDGMLRQWNIEKERVFLVLRDAGANMVKGLRLSAVDNLSCFAHGLQCVVTDAIKSQKAVMDVLTKFRSIATHFQHSVLAKQRLEAIQISLGLKTHSILQAVPTRWNSSFTMLDRMVEQKRAVAVYAADYGFSVSLTPNDWVIAEKLVATLGPVNDITKDISNADASIGVIIPHINVLKMLLSASGEHTKGIQTMRQEMLNSLNRRFQHINECKEVMVACLLDPRYKDRPLDASAKSTAKKWLMEEITSVATEVGPQSTDQPTSSSAIDEMFDSLLGEQPSASPHSGLDQYLAEPVVGRKNTDPLQWWQLNKHRFPGLAVAARKYLAVPPTSIPSERVFSTVGMIYSDRRCSLHGENAEKLCFLNYNLKLLNWNY